MNTNIKNLKIARSNKNANEKSLKKEYKEYIDAKANKNQTTKL